jgi:hypothetical protein
MHASTLNVARYFLIPRLQHKYFRYWGLILGAVALFINGFVGEWTAKDWKDAYQIPERRSRIAQCSSGRAK